MHICFLMPKIMQSFHDVIFKPFIPFHLKGHLFSISHYKDTRFA